MLVPSFPAGVWRLGFVLAAAARAQAAEEAPNASRAKIHDAHRRTAAHGARPRPAPYKVTIPNTTVSYDMVPVAGRRVPRWGRPPKPGRAAAAQSTPRRLLDAGARSHLGRVPAVHVRQPGRRDRAQGRAGGRGQPAHAAVCRDELRHGHQRLSGHQHDAACRQQIRRVAERARPANSTACRPKPNGNTPAAPARPTESFGDARVDYAWYADNSDGKYQKSPRRSRMPGASTTCSATSWSGRSTSMRRTKPGAQVNPWVQATQPYPHAVRGGSWNDPADAVTLRRARGLRRLLEAAGSAASEEHLVHDRRAVARLPAGAAGQASDRRRDVPVLEQRRRA